MGQGYQTRENGRWRLTGARRLAQNRNWKIYLLRGWYALAKMYGLVHIQKAVHYELAELDAAPHSKRDNSK